MRDTTQSQEADNSNKPAPNIRVMDDDELLTPRQMAKLKKCSERTLERKRSDGTGVPFVSLGPGMIRYTVGAYRKYVKSRTRLSTSDDGQSAAA